MKKFFSLIAMIAAVAVMGFSCKEPTPTPDPTPEKLTASVSPTEITADGQSKAVFTVKYGDKAVSNVKAYVNGAETALSALTFTTKTAGTYKFYFTYEWKTGESVKSNEVTVTAKAAEQSGDGSGLTMEVDNTVIPINTGRATFTIKFNGKVVESGYKIYKNGTETKLPTDANKRPYFESKDSGTFTFYVTYNITESTKNKPISVQVINDAIPDRAEDPNPSSTSFKRRALVMQFTGTNCGYCPYMIRPLETLAADADYKNKFTWAAIHTFKPESDPAAPHNKVDKQQLGSKFSISGYPTVLVDYSQASFAHNDAVNLGALKKAIDNSMANPASAGISATMTLDENNRVLTARVSVKAKDAKVYNVGMWVIEDKIRGTQNGDSNIESHDNAVRYVARGTDGSVNYKGYPLNEGKAMTAGQVVDYIFTVKLAKDDSCEKQPDMNFANGQLVFFVTTSVGNSYTVVNSAVTKDLKTTLPFEYNN